MVTHQIEKDLLSLPEGERARLAELLLSSLEIDPEIQQAWIEESERRYQLFRQGKMGAIPADEVLTRARAALRKWSNNV